MLWKLPEIRIAPDVIFYIGPLPVTNTLLCTWITIIILVILCYLGTRKRELIPAGMQNLAEWAVESMLGMVEGVAGKVKGKIFFPLVATFFIFILFANLLDVVPGVDTIGTITNPAAKSQALFGFLLVNYNISGRFNPLGIIDAFVGLIEIVSETARLISFSFRLFGNIFAGSVVLAVFAFLLPIVANIVFIPLELFIGFMQAFVFAILTLVFMEIGTSSHEALAEGEHDTREEHGQKGTRKVDNLAEISPAR